MTNPPLIVTEIEQWNKQLKAFDAHELIVVCDDNSAVHCLPYFKINYLSKQSLLELEIPSNENNKNLAQVQFIWQRLMENEVSRDAILICLGGGMLCDVAGFAASTYKRGIRSINVPTTNLAMTDAAIGGKTGINFGRTKNQIGTFHFPEMVLIDCKFLESLSTRELKSGFAETIKHALISDPDFWEEIQKKSWLELAKDQTTILRSMQIKQRIVESDVKDVGARQSLNFGHSFGHAFEAESLQTPTPLLHGEAIAMGMIAEGFLANKLCGFDTKEFQRMEIYLTQLFDFASFPLLNSDNCFDFMRNDKKNSGSNIRCSLIEAVGKPKIRIPVDKSMIEQAMDYIHRLIKS